MNPRDAGILASRILAIFFGTHAISGLASYLAIVAQNGGVLWNFIASFLTQGIIALVLWLGAGSIGRMIAAGASDAEPAAPRPLAHVRGTAIFILGLALVVFAIPELVSALSSDSSRLRPLRHPSVAGTVVKLVVGAGLMIYGNMLTASTPPSAHPRSEGEEQ
jgi:hypothetical protein